MCVCIHSFIHSFIHSLIHSFNYIAYIGNAVRCSQIPFGLTCGMTIAEGRSERPSLHLHQRVFYTASIRCLAATAPTSRTTWLSWTTRPSAESGTPRPLHPEQPGSRGRLGPLLSRAHHGPYIQNNLALVDDSALC